MPEKEKQRLGYIDWMRGLACLLMFQTHCYDSWLSESARATHFFKWSQLVGTLPAPLFLFLAGVSFALVTDKLRRRGMSPQDVARKMMFRGGQIFALGLGFRLQEFLLGQPWAPWTDLLRVDILNMIGLSMVLMGAMCRFAVSRKASIGAAAGVTLAVALLTPLLWTTWRPSWLPWPLESYINGVHVFDVPQPWLFPLFPWTAFAFAGLAAGFILFSDWAKGRGTIAVALLGAGGAALAALGLWFDAQPRQLYAVYDFWHTSPNFFAIRAGLLLLILLGVYAWCRWGPGEWGFSPLIQMGQTSLLVYWVHIEFVYGRFSILTKRDASVQKASLGLLAIFLAMLLLSIARTTWKRRGAPLLRRSGAPA